MITKPAVALPRQTAGTLASLAGPLGQIGDTVRTARLPKWLPVAAAYVLMSFALRAIMFGNPVIQIDEQFYLLVGERMLQGDLPYVDMWDRKPFGLFALYAAMRALGGDGILQYQVLAALSAAATAFVIHRIARQIAPPTGAFWAGTAYLVYLLAFDCIGGQTPVFYNLLVASAALIAVRTLTRGGSPDLLREGAAIMLLFGVALQIKYTVVFEGMFFGLALMWRARNDGWSVPAILSGGALWAGCAVLPTALVLGLYMAMGHGEAFLYANFLSVFERHGDTSDAAERLALTALQLAPFLLAILYAPRVLAPAMGRNLAAQPVLKGWCMAAIAGYLVFGTYFYHYAAPLLVPLAVMAAPALGRGGRARIFTILLLAVGLGAAAYNVQHRAHKRGDREQAKRISTAISHRLSGGCLFVYESDPIFYKTTQACMPTRYVFPNHLNDLRENGAIGADARSEVRRVMNTRPAVVLMRDRPHRKLPNLDTRNIVKDELRASYKLIESLPLGIWEYRVYQRKDLYAASLAQSGRPIGEPNPAG